MMPAQQAIEQHPETVHIGSRRDGPAAGLLGRGKHRREAGACVTDRRGSSGPAAAVEPDGGAEVEQLDLAVVRHQQVRRLQVGVHDAVRVHVGHRGQDVHEQPQARVDAEAALVAVVIDLPALDVFEHQVRLAGRRGAGIGEPHDVRVRQPRQHRRLLPETLAAGRPDRIGAQQLDRRLTLEAAVAAHRAIDSTSV